MTAPLSHTAQILAARRALAYQQHNPLVTDHLAQHFVDPPAMALARQTDESVHYVLLRHRRLEDCYVAAASACTQAVILGAGFDTKYQRYPGLWPRVIEVDSKPMVVFKREVLHARHLPAPECVIPRGNPSRQFTAIFSATDPEQRTFFLGEGYFMYFDVARIQQFFTQALAYYAQPPQFGFDMIAAAYADNPRNRAVMARIAAAGERVLTCCDPAVFETVLAPHGIHAEVWFPSRLARHYLQAEWEKEDDKYVVMARTEE